MAMIIGGTCQVSTMTLEHPSIIAPTNQVQCAYFESLYGVQERTQFEFRKIDDLISAVSCGMADNDE